MAYNDQHPSSALGVGGFVSQEYGFIRGNFEAARTGDPTFWSSTAFLRTDADKNIDVVGSFGVGKTLVRGTAADAYGDSFTQGYVGSVLDPANAFIARLAKYTGLTITNYGAQGTLAQDPAQLDQILNKTVSATTLSIWLSGTNDMRSAGLVAANIATYDAAVRAGIAHLSIPAGPNKLMGQDQAIVYSGTPGVTWTNDPNYGGNKVRMTTVNGATATAIVRGTSVVVSSKRKVAAAGSITVTIDGVNKGTFSCTGATASPTAGTRDYVAFSEVFAGLDDILHTVVVTANTTGVTEAFVLMIAGNADVMNDTGPGVLIGLCPRMTGAGYALGSPTFNHGSDLAVMAFQRRQMTAVCDFAGAGFPANYWRHNFNPATDVGNDGLHPSYDGHGKFLVSVAAELTGIVSTLDRASWKMPIPVAGNRVALVTTVVVNSATVTDITATETREFPRAGRVTINGSVDINDTVGTGLFVGELYVNGVAQTGRIAYGPGAGGGRGTPGQDWVFPVAANTSYAIKMVGWVSGAGSFSVAGVNTAFVWTYFPS